MKNIGQVFEEFGLTMFDAEQADVLESYADATIGELLKLSDTLKDIPVCSTFVAVIKAVNTVRDGFLVQKWLTFLKEFQEGTVDEKAIEKRKKAAEEKAHWICREIELILIRLDNISDKRNVRLLCGVYQAFLNGNCTWEMFEEIALILERFMYHDTEQLKEIYKAHIQKQDARENTVISTKTEVYHCDRLVALGLVWQEYATVLNGRLLIEYHLTEAGLILAGVL